MNKWKQGLFSLLFVCFSFNVVSQEIPKIVPPSPNAANLGEFINTPIGLHAGTPQISVPIWTIQEGGMQVPIGLNYRSGGIKVSELSSSVGLGWNLSAGGAITRSMVGLPDESEFGYLNMRFPIFGMDTYDFIYSLEVANGRVDAQPDQFYFSLPQSSGRFVFSKDAAIHSIPKRNVIIQPSPVQNMNFENVSGFGGYEYAYPSWKVVDENGITYWFEAEEKSINISRQRDDGVFSFSSWGASVLGVNTWYLTRMISPTGDLIEFNYTNVPLSYDQRGDKTVYKLMEGSSAYYYPSVDMVNRSIVETKRISSIEYESGAVEFVYSTSSRADLIGDNALQKVLIKNKQNDIVRQFDLNYKYLDGTVLISPENISISGENNDITYSESSLTNNFKRRMLLEKVVEKDYNGNAANLGYGFEYIHTYPLPNRASDLMDHWGFANKEDHSTQVHPSVQYYNGDWNIINKEVSETYCKQGTISKIIYPTGGFTEYEYESNRIASSPYTVPEINYGTLNNLAFSHGSYNFREDQYEERTFQNFTSKHYYAPFDINITSSTIKVFIKDMPYYSTGVIGFYIENVANPGQRIWEGTANGEYSLTLPLGSYRLYHFPASVILSNPNHESYFSLYEAYVKGAYEVNTTNLNGVLVGGIRIKSVKSVDPETMKQIKKEYSYGFGEETGTIMGAPVYKYDLDFTAPSQYGYQAYKVFNYGSVSHLGTTHGSFAGYEGVVEKAVNNEGLPLGKTEYSFIGYQQRPDIFFKHGNIYFGFDYMPHPPVDNRSWLRGYETKREEFKFEDGVYKSIRNKITNYVTSIDTVSRGIKMDFTHRDLNLGRHSFAFNIYHVYSGYIFPSEVISTDYDNSNVLVRKEKFFYSEKSLLPQKVTMEKSNGEITHKYVSYPKDYIAGTIFLNELISKNIVSVPIETVIVNESNSGVKRISAANLMKYSATTSLPEKHLSLNVSSPIELNQFKFSNAALGLLPQYNNIAVFEPDTRFEDKILFNSYTENGRLLDVNKVNDVRISYLWSEDKANPIAEVNNAKWNEIFFDSFEDATLWSNTSFDHSRKHSGNKSAKINSPSSAEVTALSPGWLTISNSSAKKYRFSTWFYSDGPVAELVLYMKTASETAPFTSISAVSSNVVNKWTLLEGEWEVPSNITQLNIRLDNNGSGNVWFDDVRLHPSNAQMTSYTYTPLVGMTSSSDPNNKITYYEYDGFGRLHVVKDENRNVLKRICYNYAGQPEPCKIYYNVVKSQSFTRSNCGANYQGSSYTYTVNANTYVGSSQAEADQLALDDIALNGQAAANSLGTCTLVYNSVDVSGYYYSQNCPPNTAEAIYVYMPSASYTSSVSQTNANALAIAAAQEYANTYGSCMSSGFNFVGTNNSGTGMTVVLTNTDTYQSQYFNLGSYTYFETILGVVEPGYYNVELLPDINYYGYSYSIGGFYNYTSNYTYLFGVYLDGYSNLIEIY